VPCCEHDDGRISGADLLIAIAADDPRARPKVVRVELREVVGTTRELGEYLHLGPVPRPVSLSSSSPNPRRSATRRMRGLGRWSGSPAATSRTTYRVCRCGSVRSRPTCWAAGCCPASGRAPSPAWTPADSAAVIAAVRRAGGSDALVQDVGAAMRALVTHARRLRWLTVQSEDPMWMVRYAKTATIQGAASVYVPRSALPTDEQCAAMFDSLEALGHRRWAIAMRLCHRAGLRWGELVALQAQDIEFEPARVVHVRRAVE
jgi:integrase